MSSGSEGIPGVPEFEQNFNRFSRLCKVYGVPNTHTHTHTNHRICDFSVYAIHAIRPSKVFIASTRLTRTGRRFLTAILLNADVTKRQRYRPRLLARAVA